MGVRGELTSHVLLSRGKVLDKSPAVTRGDWSREWSSQRSDEAHVTTPGVPIIELRRTGGPIVCNELPERRTGVVREPRSEALSFSLGPVTGS